ARGNALYAHVAGLDHWLQQEKILVKFQWQESQTNLVDRYADSPFLERVVGGNVGLFLVDRIHSNLATCTLSRRPCVRLLHRAKGALHGHRPQSSVRCCFSGPSFELCCAPCVEWRGGVE